MPVLVDELHAVELEERQQRRLGLGAAVDPERVADAVPGGGEALLVGVGVLDDLPLQPVRVPADDAVADRAAVVLHVEPERVEADLDEQALDDLGEPVERVVEVRRACRCCRSPGSRARGRGSGRRAPGSGCGTGATTRGSRRAAAAWGSPGRRPRGRRPRGPSTWAVRWVTMCAPSGVAVACRTVCVTGDGSYADLVRTRQEPTLTWHDSLSRARALDRRRATVVPSMAPKQVESGLARFREARPRVARLGRGAPGVGCRALPGSRAPARSPAASGPRRGVPAAHLYPEIGGVELDDICRQAAGDAVVAVTAKLDGYRGASRFTTWAYGIRCARGLGEAPSPRLARTQHPHRRRRRDLGPAGRRCGRRAGPGRIGRAPHGPASGRGRGAVAAAARGLRGGRAERRRDRRRRRPAGSTRGAVYKVLYDARRKLRLRLERDGHLEGALAR